LQALEADIVEHLDVFKRFAGHGDGAPPQVLQQFELQRDAILEHYTANLFVVQEPGAGAPVIDEQQPTYHNLFGKLEFENRQGNLVTGFHEIRAGAIHRANGGFLLLHVEELLADPRAWPKLKRSLNSRECRFDDTPGGFVLPVAGLEPEGIPLTVKVVLIGPMLVFALLAALDHEFGELFKIRADFEPDVANSAESAAIYASFLQRVCEDCGLLPFEQSAAEEVLRFGSRMAERQDRLSTRLGVVGDLCKEANHFARRDGTAAVGGEHVRAAVEGRRRRSGMVPDRIRALIAERTLRIETTGAVVGQVNGLAVVSAGAEPFGIPMRISCRTGAGRGGVVAIERETERSGSIHTKGVLVLQGLLMGLFGHDEPLAFNASITFEQSYDEVEGDSASSAELYAIVASLADVPVRQDIAVTGSVDQFGNVQAVGGVTYKVEGFFDVCSAAGLTGTQGVIVPAANILNLNLRPDVIVAVAAGQFHVWAVSRIEEAIELLTGIEAGSQNGEGHFPKQSVLGRAEARLASLRRHAAEPGPGKESPDAATENTVD
jgi:lon-related putative ATP-dependent protease